MKTVKITYLVVLAFVLAVNMISCGGNGSGHKFNVQSADAFETELQRLFTAVTETQSNRETGNRANIRGLIREAHIALRDEFPLLYDWWLQDGENVNWFSGTFENQLSSRIARVAGLLGKDPSLYTTVEQYVELCKERRALRLASFVEDKPQIVFTKFHVLRPSFFAYTEGQSDARHEKNFFQGSQLSLLTMNGIWAIEETLLSDSLGVFRDPEVDFDGKRVLFAWKQSEKESDFHIHEIDMKTRKVRQITSGLGYADIEPIYLPDGNILFNSTRVGTSVDCWFTEVSNMYICDREGRYMRQVGFDQVHTVSPALLDDGRVIFTRWDYNDRAQLFPHPLFQMNPDGTGQSEYYGMNSWFPTTIAHARQIPGTRKVMATVTGHHAPQHGKIGIIDTEAGRDENEGVMLAAPLRKPNNDRIDSWGQFTDQFQYPFPLNETDFLVSYTPLGYHVGHPMMFGIYWMDVDGNRELLYADPKISCNQPLMLASRPIPFRRSSTVDYTKTTGTYYMQNIYEGQLMGTLPKGTIKKLRVIEIEYRSAGIGEVHNEGPGGGALSSSPVGVGNTSWDIKRVHGEVDVYEDGSAMFEVPARTPLFFQALDENGHMVQTMRSWSTLMPGEIQSCVGCHEHKNSVPPHSSRPTSIAMNRGVQKIVPVDDKGLRGFSFINEVQPILDRHCISCHDGSNKNRINLSGEQIVNKPSRRNFSFAYLNLTHTVPYGSTAGYIAGLNLRANPHHPEVNWLDMMSEPTMQMPYTAGAAKSNLIKRLKAGHGMASISPEEINTLAIWIDLTAPYVGDYLEANNWSQDELDFYEYHDAKRRKAREEEAEAIKAYILSMNK